MLNLRAYPSRRDACPYTVMQPCCWEQLSFLGRAEKMSRLNGEAFVLRSSVCLAAIMWTKGIFDDRTGIGLLNVWPTGLPARQAGRDDGPLDGKLRQL